MAKLILELTSRNKEVIENDRTIEVNLPASTDSEEFLHTIGFDIKQNGESIGVFTLSIEGMEQLIQFYQENKDKVKEKKKFFKMGDKE